MRLVSPCLVILVGPSGAGKSTWAAAQFASNEIVASDDLRAAAGIDTGDQAASTDAFFLLDEIVRRRLARKLTTVVDTLGFDEERRRAHASLARTQGMPVYCVAFDTPRDTCLARNEARSRPVPKSVITKQFSMSRKVMPLLEAEDYDDVIVVIDEPPAVARVPEGMAAATEAAGRQMDAPASMRFGLQVSSFDWPDDSKTTRERLTEIGTAAEQAGFATLWVMDHFRQIPQVGRAWDPMLEAYTALSFLAGVTSSIRLGCLVTGVGYRNPAHLGKILATLDVVSEGRVICGLGIGWFEQEAVAYGWDWPDTATRYALLEDTLQLLPILWGPGAKRFDGKVISVPEAMCYPRPIQDPIPILVGGSGEKKTLRLVARYADMCNLFGDADRVARKVEVLQRHCREVDRNPDEITVTHLAPALVGDDREHLAALLERHRPRNQSQAQYATSVNGGTVEDHIGRFREFAEVGVGMAIVNLPDGADPAAIGRFGHVIDAFA